MHRFESLDEPALGRADAGRGETLLLAAIAVAALIPSFYVGLHTWIEYDGWWNVFIAQQDRWANFVADYKAASTHPRTCCCSSSRSSSEGRGSYIAPPPSLRERLPRS